MKVLVVDDELIDAELIQQWTQDEGHDVEIVLSPTECLARVAAETYDCLIVDYSMPQMTGVELLQTLRASGYETPVVVITGKGDATTAVEALHAGAHDYLVKDPELSFLKQLPTRLERAVERYRTDAENIALQDNLRRKNRLLQEANAKLAKLSITDSLTGLYNRRYLEEAMGTEFAKAKRWLAPLSCLMCDIDHFKKINDKYGHAVGDVVLEKLGEVLQAGVRRGDIVARYGGEEFVILISNTDCNGAVLLAEQLRASVEELAFKDRGGSDAIRVTISIGVDTFDGKNREDEEDLLRGADEAIYEAKGDGRNCVRVCRRGRSPAEHVEK